MAGSLKGNLSLLTRGRETRAAERSWGTAVERVIEDLEHLNRCTERDFLAVGEQLMQFRSKARQIALDMTALHELISGEHGRNASHVLARVLDRSREIDVQIEQSGDALGQVRGFSHGIRLAFEGLRNRVSVFRVLCTLTRIETSRLGSVGADFGDLSAEVGPLSEIIQSSGESVLEASSRLDEGVQSAIRSGADLRFTQLKDLPALIAGVTNSLKAFEERRNRAVESSAGQSLKYGAVCEAINDLVRSVQFHDITRQQIEHVVEALRQIRAGCEISPGNSDALPSDARAVLALQSLQLLGAARLFASSVKDMEGDLESIAVRVKEMAEASRELMGISADDQGSFFLLMEGQFTSILDMLGTSSAAHAGMESTAASLEEIISKMASSLAEIVGVELRIQRIAINATIQSAHIGEAGNALSVIADFMQGLALDSNTNTERIGEALQAMGVAARRVSGGSDRAASDGTSGTSEITREMRNTVVELHSSSESAFIRVNEIAALGTQLADDIGAVRGGFSAGQLFAQIVSRARAELEGMGAQSGEPTAGGEVVSAQLLESHASRYTMQMERDVHKSVTTGAAMEPAAPVAKASTAVSKDEDLGDNVDLF